MSEPTAEYAELRSDDIDPEAEADELPDGSRAETPLEADPADAAEQDRVVDGDDDDYR